jgi:hypothetical protein
MNFIRAKNYFAQHAKARAALAVGILIFLIFLQAVFSPTLVLSCVLILCLVALTFARPHWSLALLATYLPFEPFVLKFIPDEIYVFARYGSESLIYIVAVVVLLRALFSGIGYKQTRFDLPFALFIGSIAASSLVNFVPPSVAILGLRQILRFMIVFFCVVQIAPSKKFVERLTLVMFGILAFQSLLGVAQSFIGAPLDEFLLPSEARALGGISLTQGVEQFWDPGSRVFATLGRYDRLGNFIYFFLLVASGFLFTKELAKKFTWLPWLFVVAVPALVLTFSRASWFAFILGFLFIGIALKKDRRVAAGLGTFVLFVSVALAASGLNVGLITEAPGQSLSERFYETFSYSRWRGEYYGLGRVFWFVHTPTSVVVASPVLGFGPGQFGGGAVAALHNTRVYEELGLPFGVFGTEGFIDNNWFSLWGEAGTLGMAFYLWMYIGLFVFALRAARSAEDSFVRALSLGFCAVLIAVFFNAFTSTLLEIRTTAFYLWLYAGFVYVLGEKHTIPISTNISLK